MKDVESASGGRHLKRLQRQPRCHCGCHASGHAPLYSLLTLKINSLRTLKERRSERDIPEAWAAKSERELRNETTHCLRTPERDTASTWKTVGFPVEPTNPEVMAPTHSMSGA